MSTESRKHVHTPVTVLTGFLGSGKTTLLNRALRSPSMARTMIVINEFGQISLDHALTEASNDSCTTACCGAVRNHRDALNGPHQSEAIDFIGGWCDGKAPE